VTPLDALPDLTLAECCARWGVSSRNSIKARAAALGLELRRESSTRTVWPAEHVPLGDELAEHLQHGGTLASFPRSVPAPAAGTDVGDGLSVMAPAAGSDRAKRSSLTAPAASSDAMAALAQLAAAMAPPQPPADPLAVARGLAEAAELGAWLSPNELARLLGVAAGTVRGWSTGHRPRPGFELERRKDGASVWWKVTHQ
jgi:hypothetical protein